MKNVVRALVLSLSLVCFGAQAEKKTQSLHDQFTGQGYGMAGCGLGSVLFGEQPGPIQIIASTTNNLFGNQTFGITTGTLNCLPENDSKHAKLFVIVNKEALAKDISRGQGETVEGLSKILQCGSARDLGVRLQGSYESIFPSSQTDGQAAGEAILNIVGKDSALGCRITG